MPDQSSKRQEVKTKTVRGLFWAGGGQAVVQAIQVVNNLVLARLLLPEDFGLIGMAIVFTGLAQLFVDFGLGAAIIYRQEVSKTTLATAFWLNAGVGLFLSCVVIAISPLVASYYDRPDLLPIVCVLALPISLASLVVVPMSLVQKAMRFAELASIRILASLFGAVIAISMAASGFGTWSLVTQPVVGSFVVLVVSFYHANWRPSFVFEWSSVAGLVRFGSNVFGTQLVNYGNRNVDKLLIGKYIGTADLGYYSFAYQIMLYPMEQVTTVVVRVLFPALAKLQNDKEAFAKLYTRAVSTISMITFPMMSGLSVVAHDVVIVVFGDKWEPMTPILQVFCFLGLVQSLIATVGTVFVSTDRTGLMFRIVLLSSPFFFGAYMLGLTWGTIGVATCYLVVTICLAAVWFWYTLSLCGVSRIAMLRTLAPIALSAALMVALTTLVQSTLLTAGFGKELRLALTIGSGVISYTLFLVLFARQQLRVLLETVRSVAGPKTIGN